MKAPRNLLLFRQERMSSPLQQVTVGLLLATALTTATWPAAKPAPGRHYWEVAMRNSRLGLMKPVVAPPRACSIDHPYLVLDADRFVAACLAAMADRDLASLPAIGAIDQFVDSTDVLGFRPSLCRQVGRVYDLAAGRSAQGLA